MSQFNNLSTSEISNIVQSSGTKSLVFAYDGTRRSHLIKEVLNSDKSEDDTKLSINWDGYSVESFKVMLEHTVMMMNHGIHTVLYPMWFPTLAKRGTEYYPKFIKYLWGLDCLTKDSQLRDAFESMGIRIVFYGEWREFCQFDNDQDLEKLMEKLMTESAHRTKHILLFGTSITSPTEVIGRLSVEYYIKHNKLPTKNDMIEQYYGVPVSDIDLYIGFDRPVTDGRPPIISEDGAEDLYFTISPHSYFNETQFRTILYDHIFSRSVVNSKEYDLTFSDVRKMHGFYNRNKNATLGVGEVQTNGQYWYPSPQVNVPNGFQPVQPTLKTPLSNSSMIKKKAQSHHRSGFLENLKLLLGPSSSKPKPSKRA
ncbi:hypothetical protein SAMD00019534_120380, partial [Acytostelium subglobosum LB1]|uniref:hypothetical protein n=1 Tax=Acytostelium subglobosum LB1 TaxID=1410327 RepID=UPI000644D88C